MRRFLKSIAILILTAGAPMTAAAQTSSVSKTAGRDPWTCYTRQV